MVSNDNSFTYVMGCELQGVKRRVFVARRVHVLSRTSCRERIQCGRLTRGSATSHQPVRHVPCDWGDGA